MTTNTTSHALDKLIRVPEPIHQKHQRHLASQGDGSVSHRTDAVEYPTQNNTSHESPGTSGSTLGGDDIASAMENPPSPSGQRPRASTLGSVEERISLFSEFLPLTGSSSGSRQIEFPHDDRDDHSVDNATNAVENYPHNEIQGYLAQES
jgi:hypothetical protein